MSNYSVTMFSNLQKLFESVDQAVGSIIEQYPDEVRCRMGCADCCHAVFDVSFIEAAYIASFLHANSALREQLMERAQEAALAFERLMAEGADIPSSRIRCPLLSNENLCLAHTVRPVNCRTYGTPTVIQGKGHVCGVSGFSRTVSYPTVNLEPLQEQLKNLSVELVGEEFGVRRFPISWVILRTEFFLPR